MSQLSITIDNYRKIFSFAINFFKSIDINKIAFPVFLIATIYYILVCSLILVLTQVNFGTGVHDVGVYDQPIWLMSRFLPPYTTLGGNIIFSTHTAFYCVLLVPFFWIWDNINMLYIVQSALLGLSVLPLFYYAREKLKNSFLALAVGLSFLLYPALQNMNMENFHPEALTLFFLSWAAYFMLQNKFRLFYCFIFLSALGKEEMGLVIIFVGLFLWWFKKETRHGLFVIFFGVLWYLFCSKVVMPLADGMGLFSTAQPLIASHWFGGFTSNIFNPAYYWANIFNAESFIYTLNLLGPVLFVPLFGPSVLFMALPSFAINLLSGVGYFRSIYYHYNYVIICFIFFALIEGLANMMKIKFMRQKAVLVGLGVSLILGGCLHNCQLSKIPLHAHWRIIWDGFVTASSKDMTARRRALKLIPKDAKVSASYSSYPQLSHRKEIYMFPSPFMAAYWRDEKPRPCAIQHVDYIVIERTRHAGDELLLIDYLLRSHHYERIYSKGTFLILKRKDSPREENVGANYIVYDVGRQQVPMANGFRSDQKIKSSGTLSMLYFPDSNYYFNNLLGESITASRPMALEIFGYFFVPVADKYAIRLTTGGEALIKIDDILVKDGLWLTKGFHKYKIQYLNYVGRFGLQFVLSPLNGDPYLVPDQHLRLRYNAGQFQRILMESEKKRQQLELFLRRQPNRMKNGGFESVLGNVPLEWRIEGWQDKGAVCSYVVTSEVKKNGRYAAKIEHQGKADSRWVQEIWVKPNATYQISGWIKTENILREGTGAYIGVMNAPDQTKVLWGTNDWQRVEMVYSTDDQKSILLACRLGDYGAITRGTAYFDEIIIKEIEPIRW